MSEARQREAWGRTSHILALLVNLNRDPNKGSSVSPSQFNPFTVRKLRKPEKLPISILRDVFMPQSPEQQQDALRKLVGGGDKPASVIGAGNVRPAGPKRSEGVL